jgi:hypothetical protein
VFPPKYNSTDEVRPVKTLRDLLTTKGNVLVWYELVSSNLRDPLDVVSEHPAVKAFLEMVSSAPSGKDKKRSAAGGDATKSGKKAKTSIQDEDDEEGFDFESM